MQTTVALRDGDELIFWLGQAGIPYSRFVALRPDYLIISPPKTGSTWLADNLRQHPQAFVPSIKEIKYFSSYFRSLDLSWYLDQLAPGAGRLKGEASPSYALLSVERIRLIRKLAPQVKLVFLMRDPIGRAWSHARHNHAHREANFSRCDGDFASVSDPQWLENFTHDWPLCNGDYLGQLRRWLSVFPREQIYIGFYESIASRPEALLREVFTFLGIRADVDLSVFPVRKRILPGPPGELSPSLRKSLHRVLHDRTRELALFLRERLGLDLPPEWQQTLAPRADVTEPLLGPAEVFGRDLDDDYLSGVLLQEESFATAWAPVLGMHRGYNLVFHRGLLYALHRNLGDVQPRDLSNEQIRQLHDDRWCFVAPTLAQVKQQVEEHFYERCEARFEDLPLLHRNLNDARTRLGTLECRFEEAIQALRQVEDDIAWLWPWFVLLHRFLRPAWHCLRTMFGLKRPRIEANVGSQEGPESRWGCGIDSARRKPVLPSW
jgi:hypothetical protein